MEQSKIKKTATKTKKSQKLVKTKTGAQVVETTTKVPVSNIPADLRSYRKSGRPSNEERSTITSIKDTIRKTCADVLYSIKPQDIAMMTITEKLQYLGKMLPFVIDDDTQTAESTTMEMLIEKAIKVEMRIKCAAEIAETTEEDDDE